MSYYSCKFNYRCNQQHGSCIDTPSQQEPRLLRDRLTGRCVKETLGYVIVTNPRRIQVQWCCFHCLGFFWTSDIRYLSFRDAPNTTAVSCREPATAL